MSWANLPTEILNLVRQKLLREDYFNFRATCRGWNFAADFDPSVYENIKYPFLVRFCDNGVDRSYSCCKAYSAAYDKTYHVRAPSRLVDAHVFCSNYGWLLLAIGRRAFFYHPSTEHIITLPVAGSDREVPFQSMSFSTTPVSPDCVVFGVRDSKTKENSCFSVVRRGQRSWKHHSHVPNRMRLYNYFPETLSSDNIRRIRVKPNACIVNVQRRSCAGNFLWSDSSCSPVYYRDGFYCLARDGRLGVFRPKAKRENKMWRLFDKTKRADLFMDDTRNQAYLVEYCKGEELMSIVVAPMGEYVRIFKFCGQRKVWRVVHSLEDQTVLLSFAGCIALTCNDDLKSKGLANTVHFPRLHQNDDHHHVVYSVSTEQFRSFRGDYTSHDLYDTKLLLGSAWVIPTFSVSYGPRPLWSSKLHHRRQSIARKSPVHPHSVIRNLTFLQPHEGVGGGSREMAMQEARAGQPCFVFTGGEGSDLLVNLGKEPIVDHGREVELAARIGDRLVLCSDYGMLALLNGSTCSLLDPMSMIETTLPTWEANFRVCHAVLRLPPGDGSKLLVMAFGCVTRNDEAGEVADEEEDVAMVWQEGDDAWAVHKISGKHEIKSTCGVVVHRGNIYVLDPALHLAMAELLPDRCDIREMTTVGFPFDRSPGDSTFKCTLVESCGEVLLFVRFYRNGYCVARANGIEGILVDVKVFEMDWEMMKWRMVEDLGDQAFFWGNMGCYPCCASKSGVQRNCIYFLENKGTELYMFDYRDRTISTSLPCPKGDEYKEVEFFMWYKQLR
ncbi:unnamed protein product [Linum trigynum]|uniref:F-box domain-containing protein n=1 Tax=Linum trigynum TaxID=586398 RepID=A0AAV2G4V6_9ROSI